MADDPDYRALQHPPGGYRGGHGSNQSSSSSHARPVRVSQRPGQTGPKRKKKPSRARRKEWKALADGPRKPTSAIYILFYFNEISTTYKFSTFEATLHGSSDPTRWGETSKFIGRMDIQKKSDPETVWEDLGNCLHEPGAVVIYWGHSERASNSSQARVLRPRPDPSDDRSDITIGQLRSLLDTANAKCFIAASCATNGCISKVKRDTAIILTDSGRDRLTNSLHWAGALLRLLEKFADGGSIASCLTEANKAFAGTKDADDRLVLVSGDGKLTASA